MGIAFIQVFIDSPLTNEKKIAFKKLKTMFFLPKNATISWEDGHILEDGQYVYLDAGFWYIIT